jgi:hypothetical protein
MVQFLLGGGPGPAKQICAANPPTDLPATGTELAAQDTTTQPRALASAHLPKFASPTASNFWMPLTSDLHPHPRVHSGQVIELTQKRGPATAGSAQ